MIKHEKCCVIGDLHGRVDTLERILEYYDGYYFIFLGDTIHHKPFFKRSKRTSPLRMLQKIRKLVEDDKATLLLGNHENYVLKNLVLPKSSIKQKEVKYTLQCLKELTLDRRLELIQWLSNAPLTYEFSSQEITYRCAHAYYKPNYSTLERNQVLSGLGYPWFKQDELEKHVSNDAKYFLGHYGYPYMRKNLYVIDATNFEGVGVYCTDRQEFMVYY